MKRQKKLSLIIFLALSFNTHSSTSSEEKQNIKELQFWESMKEAQKREYRVLQARNKKIRMKQYEAMGMIRTPASKTAETQTQSKSLFTQFTEKLKHHYHESPWSVQIEPKTGSLHIKLSELKIFEHNPARLTQKEKKRFLDFFTMYLDLASDETKNWDKIKTIEVSVHNSPVYQRKFVSPEKEGPNNKEAYLFNMRLSQERASEIAHVALEQQDLAMVSKLKFTGEGYRKPLERSPATKDQECGFFDCDASRRLEIRPIFK